MQPATTDPSAPSLQDADGSETAMLAHQMMMMAAKSAREDLKAAMESLKAANSVRAARPARASSASAPCSGQTTADWRACVRQIEANLAKLPPNRERAALMQAIKAEVGSMPEGDGMDEIELQKLMQRRGQLQSMLSNMIKKVDDTLSAITQNTK